MRLYPMLEYMGPEFGESGVYAGLLNMASTSVGVQMRPPGMGSQPGSVLLTFGRPRMETLKPIRARSPT
jgi:hypothetical protein